MSHDNPIIKKRYEAKVKRFNEQKLSIQLSWAVNNANNFLAEKDRGTEKGFEKILKWYPRFLNEIYYPWMLDNLPANETKPTKKDFVEAEQEAPAKQAEQDKADEIGGEQKLEDEKERKANELSDLVSQE